MMSHTKSSLGSITLMLCTAALFEALFAFDSPAEEEIQAVIKVSQRRSKESLGTPKLNTVFTEHTSAFDALVYLNRIDEGLEGEGDTPQALSGRVYSRIANQEGRVLIRFPNIYNEEAYQGFKTFYRVIPTWSSGSTASTEENIGNCIACHIPPDLTDGKLHSVLISQEASDERVGAVKTPGLRFVEEQGRSMRNSAYKTVEDALRQHIKTSDLAKAGKLPNADPEFVTMNISEPDVPQLAAFLETLGDIPPEKYRDYRITNVRIRQDPLGEATYDN